MPDGVEDAEAEVVVALEALELLPVEVAEVAVSVVEAVVEAVVAVVVGPRMMEDTREVTWLTMLDSCRSLRCGGVAETIPEAARRSTTKVNCIVRVETSAK